MIVERKKKWRETEMDQILKSYLALLHSLPAVFGIAPSKKIESIDEWNWSEIHKSFPHRAVFLKALSQSMGISIQSIAEIGVYQGNSSKVFSFVFPDAKLYLIDPWEAYPDYLFEEAKPISKDEQDFESAYQIVKKTFQNHSNCEIIRKSSMKAVSEVPDELDLVFIDANHSYQYVRQDIDLWLPKVRSGGILSGHDYIPTIFPGVVQAANEAFGKRLRVGSDSTWFYLKP